MDLLLEKENRLKVIPVVKSFFVGQNRVPYNRDALYYCTIPPFSRSTASAGSSRLFPGNSSSIPPPSAPSTSASAPDGVDFSLLDRIGAGICGAPDEDKLPDPSDFLAGNDDDDDGDGKEAQVGDDL